MKRIHLVARVALFAVLTTQCAKKKDEPRYRTENVRRADIQAKVTATGTLTALVTVQVGSQVSGRIGELFADYNSVVKKGQVIAKLDQQLFDAALQQATANLAAAQGTLAKAQAESTGAGRQFERAKTLRSNGLIGQSEYDDAETKYLAAMAQVKVAQGSVAQARAQHQQARINLQYTTIRSPINGIVISRAVDVGQTVAASLQAPVLFTIAEDLRKMQVDTFVAEADVGPLKAGMKASFRVDAFPRETFWGVIRQIRSSPQTNQNVVTYDAVIDVANPELKLRPGMTANVTIVTEAKSNVLSVPNAALRFRPPQPPLPSPPSHVAGPGSENAPKGLKPVWVMDPKSRKPARVLIEAGITDGVRTELLNDALKENDAVITQILEAGDGSENKSAPRSVRRLM